MVIASYKTHIRPRSRCVRLIAMTILLAIEAEPEEQAQWRELLRSALPSEALVDVPAEDVDIAIVANPRPGALRGLPRLRLIQSLWAGVDRLLADPTVPSDVPLARMVDPAMNEAMAETALWAVLALHRGFFDYAAQQQAGAWAPHPQRRADEVPVAVLGMGQMGRSVAQRLAANGYAVTGWSTAAGMAALPATLAGADIVINLLPLTPATCGLFDASRFAQMRPGAALVNLARGPHVVDADLVEALDSGRLRHAVLDVFHAEPLPGDHAFWRHSRVTVLPHVAAQTDPRSAARLAADNVRALREGRAPMHLVNRARGY
jgi:glyoxylate/hydroxypyruvate reductase